MRNILAILGTVLAALWLLNILLLGIPYWSAHSKWERANFADYMITMTRGMPMRMSNPTLEIVEGGQREILRDDESSEPTIDLMFREIRTCMGVPLGFLMCQIEYDTQYGYPMRVALEDFDPGPRIIEILDFETTQ